MPEKPRGPLTERLGPGREFDAIRRVLEGAGPMPRAVRVGPGDDAAVLDGGWVLSSDLCIEGIHFRRTWLSDREIGYRAAAAALSDLAAMAAEPIGVLAAIALPREAASTLDDLEAGVREAVESVGGSVLGGDTTRSPGPLILDITVVGCSASPVMRSGARPGDDVWVTGMLGASAAALAAFEAGAEPAPELRAAFARPVPRVAEALWLAERSVPRTLIDLSDGLAGDVGHVAAASGVRIVLDLDALPVAPAAIEHLGVALARQAALTGGEDYELCFSAAPAMVDAAAFLERFGVPITRVGRVEEGAGVGLAADGEVVELGGAFDHFAEDAP